MAKSGRTNIPYGGGVYSEDTTATKSKVLEGNTAVTSDSNDEAANGTMKNLTNRATVTHATNNPTPVLLGDAAYVSNNSDGTTRAEIRYNNGEGYIINNTLIGIPQTTMASAAGLTGDKLWPGQSVLGVSSTKSAMNGGTYTPATSAQTISCAGKVVNSNIVINAIPNQKNASTKATGSGVNSSGLYYYIPVGYYKPDGSGNSWVYRTLPEVAASLGITAGDLKKGVTKCGITGTWEGFVPGNGDIYNQGSLGLATGFTSVRHYDSGEGVNWITTVASRLMYETGHITLRAGYTNSLFTNNAINLTGFSTLNIDFLTSDSSSSTNGFGVTPKKLTCLGHQHEYDAFKAFKCSANTRTTISLDISAINGSRYIGFYKYAGGVDTDDQLGLDYRYTYVYRIWMT